MKILCDEPVAARYQHAIGNRSWCTAADAVADVLGEGATDVRVSQYASNHSYVLLTRDTDFFALNPDHGVVYYRPGSGFSAAQVADGIEDIGSAYPRSEYDTIRQTLVD